MLFNGGFGLRQAKSYYHAQNEPVSQNKLFYQPLDEIRDYFGEKVAIYFAWAGLYTQCLRFPSLLGLV